MSSSSSLFSSWIPADLSERAVSSMYGGLELSLFTLLLTFVLELYSLEETVIRGVWQQKGGKSLYWTAVGLNFWNHLVLGIPVYMVAVTFLCRPLSTTTTTTVSSSSSSSSWPDFVGHVLAIVLTHDVLYWYGHKTMHRPEFYKFHKFHHAFHDHVPPSSANAVTFVEYLLVYITPFAVACLLFRPTEVQLKVAVYIVSMCNLVLHTPKLEDWSTKYVPWWLVTTQNHLEHHRKLTVHYAAPVFHMDRLLEALMVATESWSLSSSLAISTTSTTTTTASATTTTEKRK
ncbi:hypothetical protein ACA910_003493 [Epithemia clementina (nom. ined.)]